MYELLVLSLLMDFPLHAYLITDMANHIIGPWEQISRGTLSTLLARLAHDGLIMAADPTEVPFPSKRMAQAWAITPAGRLQFERLMLDTTTNVGTYRRLFRLKALHLHLLAPEDQLSLLDHYIGYCQTAARYLATSAEDLWSNPVKQRVTPAPLRAVALDLMAVEAEEWRLQIAWARRLRDQLARESADVPPQPELERGRSHV